MKKDVFLVAFSIRLPGLNNLDEICRVLTGSYTLPELESQILSNGSKVEFGKLKIHPDEEYFPQRQDAKIMRKDVLAATICAGELMNKVHLPDEIISEIPLYIASGCFVENIFNQSDKTAEAFKKALEISDPVKMKEMLYKAIPPLLALNTLTNAASSYVAQYSKLAGNNCTFGNTTIGGSYALNMAFNEIRNGSSNLAVAGATNMGELFSFLSFNQFFDLCGLWRESTGAALLMLCDKGFLINSNLEALCKIENIEFSEKAPSLLRKPNFGSTDIANLPSASETIFFSGAYTDASYSDQLKLFKTFSSGCFSWYPFLGGMGPVSSLLNILSFAGKVKTGECDSGVCWDKDPYGRESLITLKKDDLSVVS